VFLWSQAVFACHEDRPDFQLVQVKAQAKAEMHGKAKAGVSYVFEVF